jgi:hypothetical protein
MKKVSKVAKVDFMSTWEKEGETYYTHKYVMEDATELNANHKTQNPFKVGDEVEYEVKGQDPKGNNKGSVSKVQTNGYSGGGSGSQKKEYVDNSDNILYQVCLKGAIDVHSSSGNGLVLPTEEALNAYAFNLARIAKENIKNLKQI